MINHRFPLDVTHSRAQLHVPRHTAALALTAAFAVGFFTAALTAALIVSRP